MEGEIAFEQKSEEIDNKSFIKTWAEYFGVFMSAKFANGLNRYKRDETGGGVFN